MATWLETTPATGPVASRPAAYSPPLPVAIGAAAAAGVALLVSLPPYDLWWLAPVGVGLLAVAAHRRRARAGAGLGAITGLVLFVPLLSWTNVDIGPIPWLLLAGLQAGYVALQGAATAFLSPVADRWRWSWPLLTAVAWIAQEAVRSRFPFGGFPWGRLAFSQADSPLLALAVVGGAPLVTFAVALAGGLLATAAWRRWRPAALAPAAALVAAATAVVLAGLAVPPRQPDGPTVTVAIVQGNVPRLGLDFNAQRLAVLDNHVEATLALADEVAAGRQPQPDLVIWPENSSDIDPVMNLDARSRIDQATNAIGVPILVGAIIQDPGDGDRYNAGAVWLPGIGLSDEIYRKQHPVPFAEYLPLRPVVYRVARTITEEVDRIAGFTPGTRPGVLEMGPAVVGDVICFEVAYDGLVRETVTGGAELLAVQTNNATFNEAEARQQLAMVRLRAVEHGRPAVMASTVGISGFVTTAGDVRDETGFFTRAAPVRTLALAEGRTLATTLGSLPELVLVGVAVAGLVAGAVVRRRSRTPATQQTKERSA